MQDLAGKVVVLTGASSGIGRATALALARENAVVHLLARRSELLEMVAQESKALGGTTFVHMVDVRDAAALEKVIAGIHNRHGKIDVLINNAGVGVMKAFLETTGDDWDWTFSTNFFAVVTLTRLVLPNMLERGEGTIINVASLAGLMANSLPAYSASKAAVVALSESLELEYGGKGVNFVVVCPGVINTEIASAAMKAGRSSPSLERLSALLAKHGAPPMLVARDIVQAIYRPKFLVLSPGHANLLYLMHTLVPNLTRSLLRRFA